MDNQATRSRIALAGRRLLNKGGAEAVTMRRVAKSAGITAMAIYRHYPGRDALLNDLANTGFQELAVRLTSVPPSHDVESWLLEMAEIYLDHALENPRLFELMFLQPRSGARRYPRDFKAGESPTANRMAEAVRQGMGSGYFRKDDVWEIVFELGALSHGMIMLYLGGRTGLKGSRFRALYRSSFRRYINGIRK
ncbi:MAG: TetR/AcrR family transcriptional regulator [Candidatus Sulfotelmatobacter sp.]